ncbi:MAG: DUF2764 domain-containing protein [Candidatus Omnitrophica bacterium]|nr:DUF2764 domain-containing protein [Candidatus Omnitrophota bacterium]MCM8791377.1 DUF2764 domain-containing protein [Candidatus Omnitrophota bacterium]
MASYFIYLISSLPALSFGAKPPLSFEKFLATCKTLVSDEEFSALSGLKNAEVVPSHKIKNPTLRKWRAFDAMVRNELVEIRASRKKVNPAKYLRPDGRPESSHAAHIAINAYRKPSLFEAEKELDLERWRKLDEFSVGHYFDMDALVIYGVKLLILEKWDRINTADGKRLLEEVLAGSAEK